MAQFDLHLIQNVHATGIEFSEKQVNIAKGALLSANVGGDPVALAPGTNGYQLVADSTQASGLKWQAINEGHTQNTDTGTTSTTFHIGSDASGPKVKNNGGALEVRNSADSDYADLVAKALKFGDAGQRVDTIETTLSSDNTHLPTSAAVKAYADGLLAANDAMVFKGTVGTGGTIEKAALEALSTYNAGWSYRVITAGSYFGVVCEVGDLITAIVSRTGSGAVDADWTVLQTNLDGAVVGPASVTAGALAVFDGTTGKVIKAGTGAPGTMAYETATNYVLKSLFGANTVIYSTTASTPAALTVGVSTFVGRKASGSISAISATEARTILNIADGANNYIHPNHTGDVTSTGDGATVIGNAKVTLAKMANLAANSIIANNTGSAAVPKALSGTDVMNMIWQGAPADKNATGTAGMVAKDDNYYYICTATNVWKRCPIATNW